MVNYGENKFKVNITDVTSSTDANCPCCPIPLQQRNCHLENDQVFEGVFEQTPVNEVLIIPRICNNDDEMTHYDVTWLNISIAPGQAHQMVVCVKDCQIVDCISGCFTSEEIFVEIRNSEEIETRNIRPNPNNGQFEFFFGNMNTLAKENSEIRIKNITGKTILQNKLNLKAESILIDMQEFSSGIYFLEFIAANHSRIEVYKFVKI